MMFPREGIARMLTIEILPKSWYAKSVSWGKSPSLWVCFLINKTKELNKQISNVLFRCTFYDSEWRGTKWPLSHLISSSSIGSSCLDLNEWGHIHILENQAECFYTRNVKPADIFLYTNSSSDLTSGQTIL